MSKVIFVVDDEAVILDLLCFALSSASSDYEVHPFQDARKLLEVLSQQKPHLVLTDFQMPNVTGAELLEQIRVSAPGAVRILMSGFVASMRKISSAHQYLAKPFRIKEVLATVASALAAQQELSANPPLLKLVSSLKSFPAVPVIYNQILDLLERDDYAIQDLSDLLAQDGGMLSKVIHLANSPMFRGSYVVTDPNDAITCLGTKNICSLVLSLHVFESYESTTFPSYSVKQLWEHCWETAIITQELCEAAGIRNSNNGFMAGLLHDLGRMVMMENFGKPYQEVCQQSIDDKTHLCELEFQAFGARSREVAGFTLKLWEFPDAVSNAVIHQDSPWDLPHEEFDVSDALYTANILAQKQTPSPFPIPELDQAYLEKVQAPDLSSFRRKPQD